MERYDKTIAWWDGVLRLNTPSTFSCEKGLTHLAVWLGIWG